MPIDPTIALGVRPFQMPDPVESYGKVLSLRHLIQAQQQQAQMAPLEMEAAQQRVAAGRRAAEQADLATKDREIWRRAFVESGGDMDKAEELGIQYGAGPDSTMAFQQHKQELVNKRLTGQKEQDAVEKEQRTRMQGLIQEAKTLATSNPELYRQKFPDIFRAAVSIDKRAAGLLNPVKPPTAEELDIYGLSYASQDWADKKAAEARAAAEEARKAAKAPFDQAKAEADAKLAGLTAEGQAPIQPADQARMDQAAAEGEKNRQVTREGQRITRLGQLLTDARARELAAEAREANRITRENKPPTEAMRTVAAYTARMEQSENTFKAIPQIGVWNNNAPSWAMTKEGQQFDQASRNFINATLRRESGAAISQSEFDNAYKQYIPQPGDTPQVLQQKADNRAILRESFKSAAGKAYESADELLRRANGGGAPAGQVQVTDPQGGVHTFKSKGEADAFKKLAGIK